MAAQLASAAQHEHQAPAKAGRVPAAKAPIPDPRSPIPDLGWEPIRCWRQSSAGAIALGETFTLVLTCAVYEADNAQAVPDESRLGVASIQLAPFEILGGSHPRDVHRGSRRFFQYDYQLRIISRDAIGHDVNIPPLVISYRIHSRVGAAGALEGRDLSYVMPMMPIKVLSLVPADASDIRDASEAGLGAIESLRLRASVFRVLTIAFAAVAAVMAVLALVPLARSKTVAAAGDRDRIPDGAILSSAISDLTAVRSRVSGEGWGDDTVARALASTRIVAAAAIGQSISHKDVAKGSGVPEGRLLVEHGLLRKRAVTVSSPVTPDDVMRASSRDSGLSTTRRQQLEGLHAGLSAFTNALYRKEPARDASALDDAMRHAIAVASDVAADRRWWKSKWARR
ncbi:MAG TPA: hypothetical protein VM096_00945 [Vicinamibacterales bacterium]|nr:hypothetical protein [Vicinamibacterales bacterium]